MAGMLKFFFLALVLGVHAVTVQGELICFFKTSFPKYTSDAQEIDVLFSLEVRPCQDWQPWENWFPVAFEWAQRLIATLKESDWLAMLLQLTVDQCMSCLVVLKKATGMRTLLSNEYEFRTYQSTTSEMNRWLGLGSQVATRLLAVLELGWYWLAGSFWKQPVCVAYKRPGSFWVYER